MDHAEAERLVATVPRWHHRFEIRPGIVTPGAYDPQFLLDEISFPADLRGQRVLDIGPSDGFFSLAAWRRGATVVAVDYRDRGGHGFAVMEAITGARVDYHRTNIYDLTPSSLGTFDHVLFLGMLYHMPDMVRALAIVHSLCRGKLYLESHAANDIAASEPLARYYPRYGLGDDITNFWSPNPACIRAMAEDCAFDLIFDKTWGDRYFGCFSVSEDPARRRKLQIAYGLHDSSSNKQHAAATIAE